MIPETLSAVNLIFFLLLAFSGLLLFYRLLHFLYGFFPARFFDDAKTYHRYAIVIPARYESRVIENLLISIKKQDYPARCVHTFVIVESADDPTCGICQKYQNTDIFVRPDVAVKTKGGALNQFFAAAIKEEAGFDAYFIIDADNILSPSYLSEMNRSFDAGYPIGVGFRNSKNWNDGWVAACSSAFFVGLNNHHNKCRSRFFNTSVITGTGFYISAGIIKLCGGWHFESMTEDLELSLYAALNGIGVAYNERAEFFDEQPRALAVARKQHARWLRGYHQNTAYRRKLFKSGIREKRVGKIEMACAMIPIIVPVACAITYLVLTVALGIAGLIMDGSGTVPAFMSAFIVLLSAYGFFVVYFGAVVLSSRRRIGLTTRNALCAAFMNPFFFALFIPCYFVYFFKKNVRWDPIDHTVNTDTTSAG